MSLPSSLTRNSRNTMQYADAISAVWAWWDLIADPSYALREDLDIWEVAQRDPKVYQGIQQRLNSIAGRQWRVMPAGDSKRKAAKIKAGIIDAMLRKIPHFQDARRRLAQSVFRAQATELITGRREWLSLNDQPSMLWWVCTGLKNIDHRRFVMRPIRETKKDGTVRVRGQLYMSVVPTYQAIPTSGKQKNRTSPSSGLRGQFDGLDKPVKHEGLWYGRYVPVNNPEWFIRIVYDDEEARLGFGRGIQDAIYFTLWVKSIVLREGLQGLERFVHGVPVLTLDPSKRGATDQTSEQIRDAALAAVNKMRSGHAYAVNAGETLEFKEPGGTGHQMVMGFLEYLDRSLMSVITGASLRSGGDPGQTGSYASDAAGMEVQDAVVQYDRDKIDEDIGLDLIGLLCKLNRPQFQKLGELIHEPGLADEPNPIFVTVVKRHLSPLEEMQVVQGASQVKGLDLLKSEVYENIGKSMPEENDDVLKGGSAIPEPPPQVDPATGMPLPGGMPEPDMDDQQPNPEDEGEGIEDRESLFGAGSPEDDGTLFQGGGQNEPEIEYVGEEVEDPLGIEESQTPEEELVDGDDGTDGADEEAEDDADSDGDAETDGVGADVGSDADEEQMVGGDDAGTIPEVSHEESGGEAPGGETGGSGGEDAPNASGSQEDSPVVDPSQVRNPQEVGQGAGTSGTGTGNAYVKITPPGNVPAKTEPKQASGPGDASRTSRKGPVARGQTAGKTVPVKDSRTSEHPEVPNPDSVKNDLTKKGKKK